MCTLLTMLFVIFNSIYLQICPFIFIYLQLMENIYQTSGVLIRVGDITYTKKKNCITQAKQQTVSMPQWQQRLLSLVVGTIGDGFYDILYQHGDLSKTTNVGTHQIISHTFNKITPTNAVSKSIMQGHIQQSTL